MLSRKPSVRQTKTISGTVAPPPSSTATTTVAPVTTGSALISTNSSDNVCTTTTSGGSGGYSTQAIDSPSPVPPPSSSASAAAGAQDSANNNADTDSTMALIRTGSTTSATGAGGGSAGQQSETGTGNEESGTDATAATTTATGSTTTTNVTTGATNNALNLPGSGDSANNTNNSQLALMSGMSPGAGTGPGAVGPGPGGMMLGPGQELEECIRARTLWWESQLVRRFMRFCALLSLVSVSMNTPYTFSQMPSLLYITFVIDIFVTLVFFIEFLSKVRIRGPQTYFHDRWSQFDVFMLICLVASLILHVFEILDHVEKFSPLSMIRAPRPLIMVRVVRVFLSFSMPRARITQIFLRSSQQIYNVTLFFIFFMSLFGLLGVQFFSSLNHHCVLRDNYTEYYQPTIHQLAIPDTYCSPEETHGHQCPPEMVCIEINNSSGYAGFDNLAHALFTVYQSASQEGWSHVMYQAMDSLDFFRSAIYFVTLIFFLAWLVKNVFIAVITETFNEIRVQFQQMWGERAQIVTQTIQLVLVGDDKWKLVQLTDTDQQTRAPRFIRHILGTAAFQIFVMVMIVVNAIINASIKFDHSGKSRDEYYKTIYPSEVFFTIFFDVEVTLKIWCYGLRSYVRRSLHKLELLLSIGSTIHVLPPLYMTSPLVYFQVLRIIRLIKASPVLEDFVYKIFGPGKKLGSLIIFTMCLLIVTSSISMQLFCCFPGYNKFQSFPEAFMSMFQILTQEGWTEVMNETILRSGARIGPLVAIYFILYHLFVSLIVLSLFVAVILDNLELDEDIKKVKQLKAREQSAGYNEDLPLRLKLFESFPDSPQMTRLHKQASEFNIPKVRDSFMRAFIDSTNASTAAAAAAAAAVVSTTTVPTGLAGATTTATISSSALAPSSTFVNMAQAGLTSSTTITATGINRPTMLASGASAAIGSGMAISAIGNLTTATNKPMLPSLCSSGATTSIGGLFFSTRKQSSIKLLSPVSKGRHSSPLLRRVQVACIVSDSNNQRLLLNDTAAAQGLPGAVGGAVGPGGPGAAAANVTGPGAASGFTRGGVGTRGMRRSVRGNLKDEVGTEESHSGAAGNGPIVRGQDFDFKMLQRKQKQAEMRRTQRESDLRENHPFFDTPLLIVGRESRFRMICLSIVQAKYDPHVRDPITGKERKMRYKGAHELLGLVPYCDWVMIIITTISCASMMCETGEYRITNTSILLVAEYTFVFAMAIELTLKTLAYGLLFTPNAYLANVAGVMDFIIFGISVLFLCILPEQVPPGSWQQTMYVMRCIRPLRIFSLVPHMRKVVYELCRGVKEIALVSVLLIVLLFVFASVGVHMFGGLLARCNDPCIKTREQCVGVFMRQVHVTRMKLPNHNEKMPSVLVPRVWSNPRNFNFDSIWRALLALFEILSLEGYNDYRDIIIDSIGFLHAIYIHVFVFLGCMIGLTLFVGVVIANYGENKGTALLTVDQRRWCDLKKRLKIAQPLHLPPRPDHHRARAIIYDITQHIIFKRTIAILVLINSALLCVSWDINMEHTKPLANVSAVLTCIFVFEVFMKMIAFTPRGYWQSRRNRYDLFVTVLGVLWLILHFTLSNKASNAFGFIVVILRFFTITGKHATLKMLMLTVAVSVYKSFFIIMGLFLLILCYALTGVILFGSVKFGENISRHANFRTAITGVITLFRIVTGEDWNKIMHDAMLSPPFCTPSNDNFWTTDCGNYYASLAFFCSFYVCITYIVLNLLVAIIMENFSLFYSNEEDALLSYADIRNFQNTWNLVDIQQRGMIPVSRVKFVLRLLKGRLEVDPNKDRLLFKHMCHEMERLHNGEDVTFHDVLNMLSYRSVDIRKSLQLEELLAREELEFLIEEEVAKQTIRAWLDKCLRRIKKERQQQSLLNSLRATNEPMAQSSFMSGLIQQTDFGDQLVQIEQSQQQQRSVDGEEQAQKSDIATETTTTTAEDEDGKSSRHPFGGSSVAGARHHGDVKIPSFGPKFPMDNASMDLKPSISGSGTGSVTGSGSASHHKQQDSSTTTTHHQIVPHQHKRVEFRHVEERSKKVGEQQQQQQQQQLSSSSAMALALSDHQQQQSQDNNLIVSANANYSKRDFDLSPSMTNAATTIAGALSESTSTSNRNKKVKIPSELSDADFYGHNKQSSATTAATTTAYLQLQPPPSKCKGRGSMASTSTAASTTMAICTTTTTINGSNQAMQESSKTIQQQPVRRFLSLHSYPPTSSMTIHTPETSQGIIRQPQPQQQQQSDYYSVGNQKQCIGTVTTISTNQKSVTTTTMATAAPAPTTTTAMANHQHHLHCHVQHHGHASLPPATERLQSLNEEEIIDDNDDDANNTILHQKDGNDHLADSAATDGDDDDTDQLSDDQTKLIKKKIKKSTTTTMTTTNTDSIRAGASGANSTENNIDTSLSMITPLTVTTTTTNTITMAKSISGQQHQEPITTFAITNAINNTTATTTTNHHNNNNNGKSIRFQKNDNQIIDCNNEWLVSQQQQSDDLNDGANNIMNGLASRSGSVSCKQHPKLKRVISSTAGSAASSLASINKFILMNGNGVDGAADYTSITTSDNQQQQQQQRQEQQDNNKKVSQVRAQVLVNEVHDWWLLHLN